jgi:hypothetical protein
VKLDDTRQDNDGCNETLRVELDAVVKDVKIQKVGILQYTSKHYGMLLLR